MTNSTAKTLSERLELLRTFNGSPAYDKLVESILADVRELERDAERLRANSDRWLKLCELIDVTSATVTLEVEPGIKSTCFVRKQLYSAIDAAISKTKGST